MPFYLSSAQFVALVAGSNVRLGDDNPSSASYPYHSPHNLLRDFEDENDVKEEAADNVAACLQALLGDVLGALLHILDASEAAVTITVATVKRSSISAEGEGVSVRVLPELIWSDRSSLWRERFRDLTILVHLPRKRSRQALQRCSVLWRFLVTPEFIEHGKGLESEWGLSVRGQQRIVATSERHIPIRIAHWAVLAKVPPV